MKKNKVDDAVKIFDQPITTIKQAYEVFHKIYMAGAILADEYRHLEMNRDKWRNESKSVRKLIHEHRENIESGMGIQEANILLWKAVNK